MTKPFIISSVRQLPFVSSEPIDSNNLGICFWKPLRTGDYNSDFALGEHYAALVHDLAYQQRSVEIFVQCFLDMQKYGNPESGIERGFLNYVAYEIVYVP